MYKMLTNRIDHTENVVKKMGRQRDRRFGRRGDEQQEESVGVGHDREDGGAHARLGTGNEAEGTAGSTIEGANERLDLADGEIQSRLEEFAATPRGVRS